jgi:hypothetical protein
VELCERVPGKGGVDEGDTRSEGFKVVHTFDVEILDELLFLFGCVVARRFGHFHGVWALSVVKSDSSSVSIRVACAAVAASQQHSESFSRSRVVT